MSHETRTDPPTYPEVLNIHDGAFSESIWGSDGFKTIKVSGQDDVVADSYKDNLTIAAGSNVTITTNASGDTVTIASTAYTAGNGLQLSGNEFSVTALAITSVQEAANESAQLALTTQQGDVVVRADENKSYVRNAGTAGNMSDFTLLKTPTDLVLSVHGNTGAITANQIAAAVEAATDSNTFTDADHTKLNGIDTGAKDDQTSTEIKALLASDKLAAAHIADEAIDSDHYVNGSIDHEHLAGDCVDGDNIANDSIDSEHYIDGSIDEQHIANDAVTYAKMQDVSATDRILGRDSSGAGVIEEITPANLRTMINVENGADVTDTTNVTSAGAVMKTTVDAKGDILAASAADTVVKLPAGSNDQVLTADSSEAAGLKWATPATAGDPNQNAFSTVAVSGQDNVAADTTTDTLTLAAGSNVTITTNATSDTVTIAASNTDPTKMPLAGGTFTGDVKINDGEEIRVGSDSDLVIVHDGSNGTITETTGNLDIRAKNTSGGLVTISDSAGENLIKCTAGSSVELTYDGTARITTTNAGATVAGTLTATLAANSIDSDHYVDGSIDLEHLSASGTKSSSTYLRGDNTWATVTSGGASTGEKYVLYKDGATLSDTGDNTIAGYEAGNSLNASSEENTLYGRRAGKGITAGKENVAIGLEALESAAGDKNVAVGKNALQNYTGSHNVAVGYQALKTNTDGVDNVAIGHEAIALGDGGGKNIAIGRKALEDVTGDDNTAIGWEAGKNLTSGANNLLLGYGANPSSNTASNEIVLGNGSITKFYIEGINFKLKDNGGAPSNGQVLTADSNGEGYWADAASGGASLTGSTDNTVCTVTGANAIAGEANLTFDGNKLTAITGSNDSRIIHSKNTTSDGALVHYTNSSTGHATGDGFITGIGSTEDGYIWHQENNHILFGTNNTERARLTSGGDFGVGTSTPNKSSVDAAISVNGSSSSIVELCTGDARKGNIYTDGTDLYMTNNSTGWLGLHVKNNELAIKCLPDSGVELYYDGGSNKKLETVTGGVTITGTCTATTFSGSGASLTTLNASNLSSGTVATARLGSGTASSSVFLRGDGTWAAAGGSTSTGETYVKLSDADGTANNSGQVTSGGSGAGTQGNESTYYGYQAGGNSTGGGNCLIGGKAGDSMGAGGSNTALGQDALKSCNSANFNTALGKSALQNCSVSNNTAVGARAGDAATTANDCIFIGWDAGGGITEGDYNIAIGPECLMAATTGTANVNVGRDGLRAITSGQKNVNVGNDGNRTGTTASYCVSVGHEALFNNTADNGVAVGYQALKANTSGAYNTAIGYLALAVTDDNDNSTAVGYHALKANTTGYGNTAVGAGALQTATEGNRNVAIGHAAMRDGGAIGSDNVGVGFQALEDNTGSNNVAVGKDALEKNTTGQQNTAVGRDAGDNLLDGDNNTCIGYDAVASASGVDNEITLGNYSISALRCQVTSISSLSDRRDKTDINTLDLGLDFINELKPVKFKWQSRGGIGKDGTYEAGFIAQDFQQVQKDNDADYLQMVLESNPDRLEAAPGKLIPILVRAVQELSAELNTLKNTLNNG